MHILGIETSCDDTSVAILRAENEKLEVLANVVSSQIKQHAPYGGVVPTLAAREHEKNLPIVLDQALHVARYTLHDIDLIAVTSGPGLIMSLVRGVNFAKELAKQHKKQLIGVNHIEGHIYSNWLPVRENPNDKIQIPKFPALCLIVSGGHTELVLMHDHGKYELIGRTVDDAAGEAFDKIARILGLGYPGGPAISCEAEHYSLPTTHYPLPRPMLHSKDFNFSFAGLKTAVLYLVRGLQSRLNLETVRAEIAHEAQEAIVDVLISKTKKAAEKYQPKSILLAGGVSANKLLRSRLQELCFMLHVSCFIPPLEYTTDNAAMIACAAYFRTKGSTLQALRATTVKPDANWEIV